MLRSFDNFGGGAGEGPAAVCGHQFGGEGMLAEMPAFSQEIEAIEHQSFRFPAPLLLMNRL